jgi:MoxR-like ATPase
MSQFELDEQERKKHGLLRLLIGHPVNKLESLPYTDTQLGFVETGDETIKFLVRCVREGRHVMLVGPRGTGKSYMAGQAVEAVTADCSHGHIGKIEIQGDPNKPPSDYFDDSISFRVANPKSDSPRVLPTTVLAPFFQFAEPLPEGGFKTGPRDRILLSQNGRTIDRLVIFWDEGNRSSPAVLNAMLSLLAEGVIRRDGRGYRFPPVSCLLTRNPDGYDAQSAKMPSPLIDRFGVQLYVYSPRITTFIKTIAPNWLRRYRSDAQREFDSAKEQIPKEQDFHDDPRRSDLVRALKTVDLKDAKSIANAVNAAKDLAEVEKKSGKPDTTPAERCTYFAYALSRLAQVPKQPEEPFTDEFSDAVALLALVVLASWGDKRDPKEKPGMQYLPEESRNLLETLAKSSKLTENHLSRLGNLTRYGTSIRAFEDLMLSTVSDAIASSGNGDVSLSPARISVKSLEERLGWYLNHRCETNFNPDREPDKARRKTESLLAVSWDILIHRPNDMLEMLGRRARRATAGAE